jgi:hypothetical protein
MAEKPIIFNGEMVRAILGGRKTQTRRVMKPQPPRNASKVEYTKHMSGCCRYEEIIQGIPTISHVKLPYAIGDILWVQESFRVTDHLISGPGLRVIVCYKADNEALQKKVAESHWHKPTSQPRDKYFPGRFMPRWAARIFLKVKSVGVERIQDISFADIRAEGVRTIAPENEPRQHLAEYSTEKYWIELWNSINKSRGYGWDVNPYCWKYEFERVKA